MSYSKSLVIDSPLVIPSSLLYGMHAIPNL